MSLFVMHALDGPDGALLRSRHRDDHVAHITALHQQGLIVQAGPLKSEDGQASVGAMILFEAPSLAAVRKMVDADPYAIAGVFSRIDIRPYKQVFPPAS